MSIFRNGLVTLSNLRVKSHLMDWIWGCWAGRGGGGGGGCMVGRSGGGLGLGLKD